MTKFIIYIAIIGAAIILLKLVLIKFFPNFSQKESKAKYSYREKKYLLTQAENEFFHILQEAIEGKYLIFPQIHISSLVDEKVKGQNWRGAWAHIDRWSVDFVLCSKGDYRPIFAIELDDSSHEREDKIKRDVEVERIFKEINLPLIRFKNLGSSNVETVREAITQEEKKLS